MFQEAIQQFSPYTPTKMLEDDYELYQDPLSPINPIKILNFQTEESNSHRQLSRLIKQTQQKIHSQQAYLKKIQAEMSQLNVLSQKYLDFYVKKREISKKIKDYEAELSKQRKILQKESQFIKDLQEQASLKYSILFRNKIPLNHTEIKQVPEEYDFSTIKRGISNLKYSAKSHTKPINYSSNQSPLRSNSVHLTFTKKENPQTKKKQHLKEVKQVKSTRIMDKKLSFFKKYSKKIDQLQWKHNLIRLQLIVNKPLATLHSNKLNRYCYF